ncbi:MAG: gluconokinase [Bacteroidota bacterium]|jgi:carbohydrate kinase (thermoresistant glucokinase family)
MRAKGDAGRRQTPCVILLMGVSGSGKSTIGRRLGAALGWPFRDADSFHPQANIDKMSRGIPLTDEDRAPWLEAIAAWIDERLRNGESGVVSCSALKRAYRRVLRHGRIDAVGLVYLRGSFAVISVRMSRRKGHFMPPALLKSQFQTLEPPTRAERALVVSVRLPPKKVTETIMAAFGLHPRRLMAPAGSR